MMRLLRTLYVGLLAIATRAGRGHLIGYTLQVHGARPGDTGFFPKVTMSSGSMAG